MLILGFVLVNLFSVRRYITYIAILLFNYLGGYLCMRLFILFSITITLLEIVQLLVLLNHCLLVLLMSAQLNYQRLKGFNYDLYGFIYYWFTISSSFRFRGSIH